MILYVDMDGVLVDFHKEASKRIGYDIDGKEFQDFGQNKRNQAYSEACDTVEFWSQLEPMQDYDELWGFVRYWNPQILTAYPQWGKSAIEVAIKGKKLWNKTHMMVPDNRFHVVARVQKQNFALNSVTKHPNVLIDDKDKNIEEWIKAGGIGILHISAKDTIKQLERIGYTK